MSSPNSTPLTGLARKLVLDQILSETDVQQAIQQAGAENISLNSYLIKNKMVTPNE